MAQLLAFETRAINWPALMAAWRGVMIASGVVGELEVSAVVGRVDLALNPWRVQLKPGRQTWAVKLTRGTRMGTWACATEQEAADVVRQIIRAWPNPWTIDGGRTPPSLVALFGRRKRWRGYA